MNIREFQDLIRRTYHERDSKRGLDLDFIWFTEEVGELAEAVRTRDVKAMKEEAADVLAWLVTCCSMMGVDVEEAALAKYGAGCPRCAAIPCRCA